MGEGFLREEEPKAGNVCPSDVVLKKLVDKTLVQIVFQFGKKSVTEAFVLFVLNDASSHASYATYIKKAFGRAVERNRAKRIIRASLYHTRRMLSGHHLIILPRKKMKSLGYWPLVREWERLIGENDLSGKS